MLNGAASATVKRQWVYYIVVREINQQHIFEDDSDYAFSGRIHLSDDEVRRKIMPSFYNQRKA